MIRAVVTDGLTIGHWRCSASAVQLAKLALNAGHPPPSGPCRNPLTSVRSRFCPVHHELLHNQCQAQPCTRLALAGKKTCDLETHMKAAKKFDQHVHSNFTLHSMLNRPGASLPVDPTVHQNDFTAELEGLEDIRHANEAERADESHRDGGDTSKKAAPKMSRLRTHNDQLIVATCGVILARQTMFHSESPSAVKVSNIHLFLCAVSVWCH